MGPAVPKAWVGTRGAADGLLNLAIRSLSDPDTARGLASPVPGEDDREWPVGGVRLSGLMQRQPACLPDHSSLHFSERCRGPNPYDRWSTET